MKAVIFKSQVNGRWFFRIVAKNGRTIAQSEGYNRRASAIKTLNVLRHGSTVISIA